MQQLLLASSLIFTHRRKVFFVGAMGSGKTEIAINYAAQWGRAGGGRVGLLDLDMVKPSFRLRSAADDLKDLGVELILPDSKYGHADFPIISAVMESRILDPASLLVVDAGGDAAGALMIGRYRGRLDPRLVDLFFVFNARRPFSRGEEDIYGLMDSIERACGFEFTGLVHNSHLMGETRVEVLAESMARAEEIAKKRGIPVQFQCIMEDLFPDASKMFRDVPLLPLKLFIKPVWERRKGAWPPGG
jgi:hypothetical protein